MTDAAQRILIVAHGHPDLSKGGAETAAHRLFVELERRPGIEALFLARADGHGHGTTPFSVHGGEREILCHVGMSDYFLFRSSNPGGLWRDFRDLLRSFRPTVVHFHHYIHIGLEVLRVVRSTLPDARIVLTLHEYLAICNNQGQMIKTDGRTLCHHSAPAECHRCFPERSPGDFFMRERYVKSFMDLVDTFISPSRFLLDRYVQWGLAADRIVVVENGHPPVDPAPPRTLLDGEGRGRFAYFGQITPFKGLDVLLEAVARVPKRTRRHIHVDVHGAGLERQPQAFVERVGALRSVVEDHVTFHGTYQASELASRIAGADWVVVPSVWWENSPVVIQEAFAHRRPVICSDIGGLAEKVSHEVDGLHFRCHDPQHLAATMVRAMSEDGLWETLSERITPPLGVAACVDRHQAVYAGAGAAVLSAG